MNRTFWVSLATSFSITLRLTAQPSGTVASSHLEKAGNIMGMAITDSGHQHVGSVSELAIDMQAGRVAEVLIDTGGTPASEDRSRIVAVPPESLAFADSGGELRLNANVRALNKAPAFDVDAWEKSTDGANVAAVYRYFHAPLYSGVGRLARFGNIIGLTAYNHRTQRLGKVDDFVVDLPDGRIPDVIFASKGLFGGKEVLTAVPPQLFIFSPDYDTLLLDTTKKALRNTPHFKPGDWRSGIQASLNPSTVDDTFKVLHSLIAEGDADTAADNTVTNKDQEADDSLITLTIQDKITATRGLSEDARHVQVTIQNGRVTLNGVADTKKEKEQLGAIAASVVGAGHVDNQIRVKVFALTGAPRQL